MKPWTKESLNLQVGDRIIWCDREIVAEGDSALVTPGMKGNLLSLHDGFHLDVIQGDSIPPKAVVQSENGMTMMVDERMKW